MAHDGVIQALGRDGPIPAQDLAALMRTAVERAGELAPEIIALTEKAAGGVYLLPRQRKVLRLGLQALAVAGERRACKPLLRLLRSPPHVLEELFGEEDIDRAVSLLSSLYDGDADALFDLAADRDVSAEARWTVFLVLARLAHDGRIARDRLVEFLDRFDRERLAQDGDLTWIGWEDAILSLGLLPFAERVERAWEDGRRPDVNEADKREWRERLARMAANPGDDSFLVENKVVPITDPLAGLDDLMQRPETARPSPREGEQRPDPAEAICLSDEELDWLAGFLSSDQVPVTTMSLEELDGYFAALQVSPAIQVPLDYLDLIWGTEIGARPAYDSVEQEEFVNDLVARLWQTLKKRLFADVPHRPYLFSTPPEMRGLFWAQGFMFGAGLDIDAWRPMLLDEVTGPLVQSIMALAGEEFGEEPLDPEMRKELLQRLPEILQLLYELAPDYDPAFTMPRSPVRSQKIGRNEPCPCGSGKKFKKCCGTSGAIGS